MSGTINEFCGGEEMGAVGVVTGFVLTSAGATSRAQVIVHNGYSMMLD